jgi:hypothetical protein
VSFTDDFGRLSLGPDWADDGPILFQGDGWVRGGQFLSGGAWQVDENNSAGVFDTAMGSIRHVADACADQFIEAVVGNFFQGHDASVPEELQWVEGDVWLFAQLSPGSDVGIGAHFVIHTNGSDPDGEAFVEFFTTDEAGDVTFTDNFGSSAPLTGWQANPDYTIRFEVSAAGHLKAYSEGDLLAEDDVAPLGGRYVGIGMQWNRTDYAPGEPNPGVSFQFKSVTGSFCTAGGWRIGRAGWGTGPW